MSLEINDLAFSYEGFNLHVNLQISQGEFISVLGPSGSGKTTLLRLAAGFLQPEKGSILLNRNDITALPTSKRNIGMVFQDYALFPHMNVFKNIAYGLEARKSSRNEIKERVMTLLEIINLEGYGSRKTNELSGGEKQRVALARALAPEPELLLFDEPLSALDVKLRKRLRKEIRRIQKELGFTAVYVTHDQEEAMAISDRVAVMDGGKIIQLDSAENIYQKPADIFTADFIGTINRYRGMFFRPEACRIMESEEATAADGFTFEANIISSEYAGGFFVCESESNQEIITFYCSRNPGEGTTVKLQIDESRLITL